MPHFQSEVWCTTFHMKMSFICICMKTRFHMKGWAPSLALKKRHKTTRKLNGLLIKFFTCTYFTTPQGGILHLTYRGLQSSTVPFTPPHRVNFFGVHQVPHIISTVCPVKPTSYSGSQYADHRRYAHGVYYPGISNLKFHVSLEAVVGRCWRL